MKKKVVIPTLCFAALSTVAFEEAVQAADPPTIKAQMETKFVTVNQGSVLNLRSSASPSSSVIAKLPRGTEVSVESEAGGWAKVIVNGKSGYVSGKFLSASAPLSKPAANVKQAPTLPAAKSVTKYVNVNSGSSLNMRSSASPNGSVVAKLSRGTKVSVQSEAGGWAKVIVNGKAGYISSQFLSANLASSKPVANVKQASAPATPKTVTKYINVNPGASLNMRSSASTSGKVIAKLQRGTKVSVQSEAKGWAKITASGKTGYVSTQYLSTSALANKPAANTKPVSSPTSAKTVTKYVNINPGASLNMRSSASTSGKVIAKLQRGTKVSVQSEAKGWAKITANGKSGYVSTSYLSSSSPAASSTSAKPKPTAKPVIKYVNVRSGSSLNVRGTASTSGKIVGKLSSGTSVSVESESKGWAKVKVNGITGYVSTSYLSSSAPAGKPTSNKPKPTAKPVTKYVNVKSGSSLNVRGTASTSGKIVGKLSSGTAVSVESESKGWAKVKVNGITGYVSSDFLTTSAPSSKPPIEAPVKTTTKYVNVKAGSTLNMRSTASASGSIIDRLTRGTAVEVESESKGWAKVKVNGKTGYVSSEFLSTDNENSQTVEPKTKYINTSSMSGVSMYKDPSTNSSIMVNVAAGVAVQVISEENGWAKVKVYGSEGYIQSKFLSDAKPDTKPDEQPQDPTDQIRYVVVKSGSNLNMRSGPSTDDKVITTLSNGTAVKYHSEANGWAKVTANGKTGYVSVQYLSSAANAPGDLDNDTKTTEYSNYNLTLDEMVKIQMGATPQTDKKYQTFIREDALKLDSLANPKSGIIQGGNWNVRTGAATSFSTVGQVQSGTTLKIISSVKGTDGYTWYQVDYNKTWVNAAPEDVKYYLDPNNFINDPVKSLQFINLSKTANAQAQEINDKILSGKGILSGKAAAFIEAGKLHGVNEMYLISHALLETGNGKSQLASGVKVNGKTVYNMYGIGAYDGVALQKGAEFAYNAGWFTPEAAIIGGAQFIGKNYISAGQNTLYKMRWNPTAASNTGKASHQYATDIGWAVKQITQIHNLYTLVNSYTLVYDIPVYKKL